jgi:transposase
MVKTIIDWRKLNHEHLEILRLKAIKMRFKGGMEIDGIAKTLWLWSRCISTRIAEYKKHWKKWLKAKKWKWWKKKSLDDWQLKELEKIIIKWPKWAMLDYWLRTIRLIKGIIKKKFKKDLHETTIKRILNWLGFSNQKPLYRAFQKDPKLAQERVENILPEIEKEAKKENREILYWDEAGVKSNNQRWKTRGKKWITPIVENNWIRFWINSISAISKKWEMRFMCYEGSFVIKVFLDFLKRLLYKNSKKITLILDWHRVHKAKSVQEFVKQTNGRLKIHYLPPYSPELNPDELVWNDLKNGLKQVTIRDKRDLKKKVKQNLHRLQKQKHKVKSFFRK